MNIVAIAGMAVITDNPKASAALYSNLLQLPLQDMGGGYIAMSNFDGSKHFGVWPLSAAAQSCFGKDTWPSDSPLPTSTIEFELADEGSVQAAVDEIKRKGQRFLHEARREPWGQTVARFISPEGVLIGLSYIPSFHGNGSKSGSQA